MASKISPPKSTLIKWQNQIPEAGISCHSVSVGLVKRGQSGAAVRHPHGMHQDVGSNPAAARNEKTDIGQTPAQKVPQ